MHLAAEKGCAHTAGARWPEADLDGVLGVGVENTYFLAMIFEILSLGGSPEYWVS